MSDLANLTLETFEACLEERFDLDPGEGSPLALMLVEASAYGSARGDRQPFSLIFRGPMEPVLTQQIYSLSHATLGELGLFLVPVGPDDQGMCYEAVFN